MDSRASGGDVARDPTKWIYIVNMDFRSVVRRCHQKTLDYTCKKRVVFHHVPKCGGTSVGRALRIRYLLSQATILPEESFRTVQLLAEQQSQDTLLRKAMGLRQKLLLYLMFKDVRCISAHVAFTEEAYERFFDKYIFITLLREPVSRYISHYYWSYGRTGAAGEVVEPIDKFITTERGRNFGAIYPKFFSGLSPNSDFRCDDTISKAKENLGKFAVIGFLNAIPAFEKKLKEVLGCYVRIGHANRSGVMAYESIDKNTRQAIAEICQPDREIFEYAVKTFS